VFCIGELSIHVISKYITTLPLNIDELRFALRKRYIPSFYDHDLMNQLHWLTQKDLSVNQYCQKMDLLLLRADTQEEPYLTIARFLIGLNFDIRDRVELLPYNDLVQLCIRVEDQLNCKLSFWKSSSLTPKYFPKDFVGFFRRTPKDIDLLKTP